MEHYSIVCRSDRALKRVVRCKTVLTCGGGIGHSEWIWWEEITHPVEKGLSKVQSGLVSMCGLQQASRWYDGSIPVPYSTACGLGIGGRNLETIKRGHRKGSTVAWCVKLGENKGGAPE